MVIIGHTRPSAGSVRQRPIFPAGNPIAEVRFHNPGLERLGLETMTLAALQSKAPPEHFARPQRIEFYLLILFTGGRGEHHVDFVSYLVRERTLVVVQPKQVQQFHFNPA